jgi:hypothetical protein
MRTIAELLRWRAQRHRQARRLQAMLALPISIIPIYRGLERAKAVRRAKRNEPRRSGL